VAGLGENEQHPAAAVSESWHCTIILILFEDNFALV
jgi:hypothetical protein